MNPDPAVWVADPDPAFWVGPGSSYVGWIPIQLFGLDLDPEVLIGPDPDVLVGPDPNVLVRSGSGPYAFGWIRIRLFGLDRIRIWYHHLD